MEASIALHRTGSDSVESDAGRNDDCFDRSRFVSVDVEYSAGVVLADVRLRVFQTESNLASIADFHCAWHATVDATDFAD